MKIFKISQSQQFTMIQPNPTAPQAQNLGLQVQNMQMAQQALNNLSEIVTAVNELKGKAAEVEDLMGGNAGLGAAIDQAVRSAISQNSAMSFMIQMNLVPSADKLFDAGFMSTLSTQVAKNITSATEQQASAAQMQGPA